MASRWIDVSVPLKTDMVHWPGDPVARISRTLDLERGDSYTVSFLEMGAHTGTHIDAPAHCIRGGRTIDDMPPDAMIGRGRVIAIRDRESVKVRELERHGVRRGERILLKTVNSGRCWQSDAFVEEFVYIAADAAHYLAARGVRLVGVDYLSVGAFRGDGEETHKALLGAGVWIIEGLNLAKVRPGPVEFVCLPLKLLGADGAPARALIRPLQGGGGRR